MAVFPSKSSLVATQEPDVCCPLLTGQPPFTELGLWLQEKLWNTKVGNSSAPSTFALGKGQGEPRGFPGTLRGRAGAQNPRRGEMGVHELAGLSHLAH